MLADLVRRQDRPTPSDSDDVVRFAGHPPHRHDTSQLVHVAVGNAVLLVADVSFAIDEGEGVWVPAGVVHALDLDPGGLVLGPLLSPGADPPGGVPWRVTGSTVRRLMTTLLGVAPRSARDVALFRGALERELAVLGAQFPLRLPTHPAAEAIARDAVRSRATLTQLAAREFVSPRQVQRLFTEQTGLPFATWRTRARLNEGLARLQAGQGFPAALRASGFTTREGLLKALGRETGRPALDVLAEIRAR